jgi:hypothetical protein
MKKQYGVNMHNTEEKNQEIDIKNEVSLTEEDEQVLLKQQFRDEVFEKLKAAILKQNRLLGRFIDFCDEYNSFEYDEMGMNMEEGQLVLDRAEKISNKFLDSIEQELLYIFENREINHLTNIISFNLDAKEYQYKVILEVLEDSINLEVI